MKCPNVLKNVPPLYLLHHKLFSVLSFGAETAVPKMQEVIFPLPKGFIHCTACNPTDLCAKTKNYF